jgi:hypothetical protein
MTVPGEITELVADSDRFGGGKSTVRFLYSRLRHRWRILPASAVINQMAVLFTASLGS